MSEHATSLPEGTGDGVGLPAPAAGALDYFGGSPQLAEWVVVARCGTVGEWYALRRGLMDSNIDALMREDEAAEQQEGDRVELLVRREWETLALAILAAQGARLEWCPSCGATEVGTNPAWRKPSIWATLFGVTGPAAKKCGRCGREWG